jgi:hypothetical protein
LLRRTRNAYEWGKAMWMPPMLVLPLIAYNLVAFHLIGDPGAQWTTPAVRLHLPSAELWTLTLGDAVAMAALALLFVAVVRAGRAGRMPVRDLVVSAFVFGAYLVEFLAVPAAATTLFFLCMAMSATETAGGFAVALRHAEKSEAA